MRKKKPTQAHQSAGVFSVLGQFMTSDRACEEIVEQFARHKNAHKAAVRVPADVILQENLDVMSSSC
jgi:DNA-binding FrmR family transcriptional regulator